MKVPTVDLKQQYNALREEIDEALQDILDSSCFILGEAAQDFERQFSSYCGTEHAVAVSSGTAALKLIYSCLDLEPGDEVITSPFTFTATVEPLIHKNIEPVFADVNSDTFNLDPAAVEQAITPDTRAIVAVHLYGQPADMDGLRDLADLHDLRLIEDAAQAHGACWNDHRVGSLGDMAAFSFYPAKNLGAFGDAGAVTTDDGELAARLRKLRNHGRDSHYGHVEVGYNERMDGIQAAVLNVKLPYLDEWNETRRDHAERYNGAFGDHPMIDVPSVLSPAEHVYYQYVIKVPERDRVLKQLRERDIGASVHYPTPLHLQKSLSGLGHRSGDFPASEQAAESVLSLPVFSELSEEQISYVISSTLDAVDQVAPDRAATAS